MSGEQTATFARGAIASNFTRLFSTQAITFILSLSAAVLLPRYIAPDGLGQIRLAASLWAIAQVLGMLGTDTFLTLQFARDPRRAVHYVWPVIVLRLAAVGVTTLPLVVIALVYDRSDQFLLVMALTGVTTIFVVFSETFAAALVGLEQMKAPATANVATVAAYAVGAITVLVLGGGVVEVMIVTAVAALIPVVMLSRAYRACATIHRSEAEQPYRWILKASMTFLAAQLVLIVYQQIDTVVIAVLVDQETLGWYALADSFFGALLFIIAITGTTFFPVFGRLHSHNPERFRWLVEQVFGLVLLAGVPVGLGIVIVARDITPMLFGEAYAPAGDVVMVVGPVVALVYVTSLLGTVALATGREKLWNVLMVVAIAVSIPLDLVLVPWTDSAFDNGAIGGVLAYVVTESMIVVVGLVLVAPFLHSRPTWIRAGKIGAAGALMFLICWPLREQFFLIPAAVGAAIYVGAIAVMRVFDAEERAAILAAARETDS